MRPREPLSQTESTQSYPPLEGGLCSQSSSGSVRESYASSVLEAVQHVHGNLSQCLQIVAAFEGKQRGQPQTGNGFAQTAIVFARQAKVGNGIGFEGIEAERDQQHIRAEVMNAAECGLQRFGIAIPCRKPGQRQIEIESFACAFALLVRKAEKVWKGEGGI